MMCYVNTDAARHYHEISSELVTQDLDCTGVCMLPVTCVCTHVHVCKGACVCV